MAMMWKKFAHPINNMSTKKTTPAPAEAPTAAVEATPVATPEVVAETVVTTTPEVVATATEVVAPVPAIEIPVPVAHAHHAPKSHAPKTVAAGDASVTDKLVALAHKIVIQDGGHQTLPGGVIRHTLNTDTTGATALTELLALAKTL